jgi:hypothetical protein
MHVCAQAFWLPKDGNAAEEYEDAFQPDPIGAEWAAPCLRYAIADGSSDGLLSGEWARMLTHIWYGYRSATQPADIDEALLETVCTEWSRWLDAYQRRREEQHRPVQWYEEPGLERGAFSSLLGFTLVDEGARWYAAAVGDSCLFQIRREEVMVAFPLEHAADFTNSPLLIGSRPERNQGVLESVRRISGDWQADDRFYLATDALAAWFLREQEAGKSPWRQLRDLAAAHPNRSFDDWVHALREAGHLRNDDITLIGLDIT